MRRYLLMMSLTLCPVLAAASIDAVRFTASPSAVQMRIEIRSAGGALLYDSEWRDGNLLDWALLDSFGHPLAYGAYRVRVLSKSLDAQTSEKEATLRVEAGGVAIDGRLNETPKITLTAHDGEIGQLVTSSGDLSFRFGGFLNRKDAEKMRLTAEGDLGIGTDKPQARLDVNGLIRTSEGILFPDGSIQRSAAMPSVMRMRPSSPEPEKKLHPKSQISGAGTTNRVTKWLDGAGTVGDSAISEVSGNVGIGIATPGGQLHIYGISNTDVFAGMGPDVVNGPGFNYGYAGGSFGVGAGFFNVRPAMGATGVNPSLRFMTVDAERMIITNAGNVGIGTSAPAQKLDVVGTVKASTMDASTQYNIGGQRILSKTGSSNLLIGTGAGASNTTGNGLVFVGPNAGSTNTTGVNNTFVGLAAGQNNNANNNSFFGAFAGIANTSGLANAFFGTNAGASNTTGLDNSFFGLSAGYSNLGASAGSFFGYFSGYNSNMDQNSYFGYRSGYGAPGGTGSQNAFFGSYAGQAVANGTNNSAFGFDAGYSLTNGLTNAFFGANSGYGTTTGGNNTFAGYSAGDSLTTESANTIVGYQGDGAAGITNATAIGNRAYVGQSNALVLGSVSGVNSAGSSTDVGIGTTTPKARLDVATGDAYLSTAGNGVILKSPNGLLCKKLTIDNTGGTVLTTLTCP